MKKKIIIYNIVLLFILTAISINKKIIQKEPTIKLNGLPVYSTHAVYAFDTSTPEKAYGASRYVFIAKVNEIIKTEYVNPTEIEVGIFKTKTVYEPVTIYSISVIKNIKGNLITTEPIQIKQYGGISKDKKSYVFDSNSSLLNINGYYMFLTGAEENGGILEATNPNRMIFLGTDLELIENIEAKNIESKAMERGTNEELVKKIESYMFVENEEIPTRFNESMTIPVLDNISKYDINYVKQSH